MGQFKPMVKMMTTEPSVELKLKKGGHAKHKSAKHSAKAEHGHKPMHHMMDGGVMGALAGATPVIAGRTAAPVARVPARPSMAARRRAMVARPVKKGGEIESKAEHAAEMKKISKVEHELKSHEGKKASMAHKGLKKGGKCYATGGAIPSEETYGDYKTTEVHQAKADKSSAKTGEVKEGNAGGFKHGGKPHKKHHYATGGVALSNAGGFKKGGKIHHKSTGGAIPSETTEGNYDVTEVHQAKADKAHGTGGIKESNAGGYKKGGHSKKAFASGGSVQDEGRATSMPQGAKKPSAPVAINMLSGSFKKGGNVSSKKLQNVFMNENATATKEAKAKLLDKYSPYQKADGGQVSDSEYQSVMQAEKAGKKTMIDKPVKSAMPPKAEKRYPSGLSDSDIDKVLSSKKFQEGASHFSDYKRGGKAKK